jgi:predicted dienelactone hydrolase
VEKETVRTLEIIILLALFLRFFGYSFTPIKRSHWIDLLPSLAVLLIVIHLVLEKYRWQMVPAYGLTLLLFLLSLPRIKQGDQPADKRPSRRVLVIIGFLFRLLIFVLVAALPLLLPVFRLPEPTGSHPVGVTRLHLVDRARPETFTPNPDDHREFMVQVWYPAQVEPGARPAGYLDVPFQFSHLSLVQTHSYLDAPVSNAQSSYPVLIFSHGYISLAEHSLTLMEELASHGYVVYSIAHPYHAISTIFPDGRVVSVDRALSDRFMQGNPPTQDMYAEYLRIWTDDTVFLIDELQSIQAGEKESAFVGKLDMARLGIFGVSFGGVTAVQVCAIDDRCQAGISLDAGLPRDYTGRTMDSPLKQPFMFMSNEGRRTHYTRANLDAVENTAYEVTVRGTTHLNFADIVLYWPVLKFTKAFGSIDGYRMVEITNAYTLAFFDKHLRGEMSPLLDGPSPDYPDVEFQSCIP